MPTITLPYTPANGDVLESREFSDTIAYANGTAQAFDTVNGFLDEDNLVSVFKIDKELVQPNTWHDGVTRASTTRRDYFYDPLFADVDLTTARDEEVGYSRKMVGVAGAGASWHNRTTLEYIVLQWEVVCVGDSNFRTDEVGVPLTESAGAWGISTQKPAYRLALHINGRRIQETDFRFKKGTSSMAEVGAPGDPFQQYSTQYQDLRVYAGTLLLDSTALGELSGTAIGTASPLIAGHHSAGIYVVSDGGATTDVETADYSHVGRPWGGVRFHTTRFSVHQRYGG